MTESTAEQPATTPTDGPEGHEQFVEKDEQASAPGKGSIEKRIGRLTREKYDAIREKGELERLLEQQRERVDQLIAVNQSQQAQTDQLLQAVQVLFQAAQGLLTSLATMNQATQLHLQLQTENTKLRNDLRIALKQLKELKGGGK